MKGKNILISILSISIFLAIWQVSTFASGINSIFLPSPYDVFISIGKLLISGVLLKDSITSITQVWIAFSIAALMSIPIGIGISSSNTMGYIFEPLIDFIRYLPVPAIVPLAIIWFGIGTPSTLFLLWLGTFFQLVLLIIADARRVPKEFIESSYTLGYNKLNTLIRVVLPSMGPSIYDNLRITLGWCWTYLIIAELVASNSGLGYLIWTEQRYMETSNVMAGVVTIGLIGLFTDQFLRLTKKYIYRYL